MVSDDGEGSNATGAECDVHVPLSDDDIERQIERNLTGWLYHRKQVGFTTDPAAVVEIARSKEARRVFEESGSPFTADEAKELNERGAAAVAAADIQPALSELPGYAGIYNDHSSGTVQIAATAETDQAELQEIINTLPDTERISVRIVKFSKKDLQATQRRLLSELATERNLGLHLEVAVRQSENRLHVAVGQKASQGEQAALEELLRKLAGDVDITIRVVPPGQEPQDW